MLLDKVDAEEISAELKRLAASVFQDVGDDGVPEADRVVAYDIGIQFFRQTSELSVALDGAAFDAEAIRSSFLHHYAARYGMGAIARHAQLQVTFLRAVASGRLPRATFPLIPASRTDGVPEPSTYRAVFLDRKNSEQVPCYRTPDLAPGDRIHGPALADDVDTTVFIPRGAMLTVGARGSLRLDVRPHAA
jgi:N-methylhydantoinase A